MHISDAHGVVVVRVTEGFVVVPPPTTLREGFVGTVSLSLKKSGLLIYALYQDSSIAITQRYQSPLGYSGIEIVRRSPSLNDLV